MNRQRLSGYRHGTRRLFDVLLVLFALAVVWQYIDSHSEAPPRSRLSLRAATSTFAVVMGIFAAAGIAGFVWHRLKQLAASPRALRRALAIPAFRLAPLAMIAAAALAVFYGPGVLSDVGLFLCVAAGFTVYLAVHAACGLHLLRRGPLFKVRMGKLEGLLTGFLLGMGLDAVLLFALASLGLPLRLAATLILIGLTWLGRRELADLGRSLVTSSRARTEEYCLKTAMWWGAFGALGIETFFLKHQRVASPAYMFDAAMIHLAAAKCYVVRDAMPFLPQIRTSHLVPLIQCQFTSVLLIFGDLGPKLLEGAYYIALGICTYTFAM